MALHKTPDNAVKHPMRGIRHNHPVLHARVHVARGLLEFQTQEHFICPPSSGVEHVGLYDREGIPIGIFRLKHTHVEEGFHEHVKDIIGRNRC